MSTTFKFEELDGTTHDYLVAVRDSGGLGSPGVFASTKDTLPGCGCIAGPIVVVVTLLATLTTWAGIIYDDPVGVALLQTAGLLVGGWLIAAGFRGGKGTDKVAGTWVFVDPLFLCGTGFQPVAVGQVGNLSHKDGRVGRLGPSGVEMGQNAL